MKAYNNNSTEVVFNTIEKETAKAYLINIPVTWNSNMYNRSFWFPKSCVKIYGRTMDVATFIIEKMEQENAFHGYRMNFEIAR